MRARILGSQGEKGMKGRKPLPTKLKLLCGNPGKQKLPKGEPEPDANIPTPPDFLNEYAVEEWNRVTAVLLSLGLISDLTVVAVIAYCDAYSDWRTATEELNKIRKDKSGLATLIQQTSNGNIIPNQLKLVAKAARADMIRYATEFGGTEIAKIRLAIDPGRGKKKAFEGLINGGKK
jgi:P27 family predicted phage terminase small subunit